MRVVKNYLYNIFYQVFVLIVPVITTPYLARVLGPTGVGINSYTNSIIQYFILFGSIGINLYGNRQIAFKRDNRQAMTQAFYEIFILRLISMVLAFLAFGLFLMLTTRFHVYYLAQGVSLLAAAFDISWFFMGVENFAVTVLRNFVVKIITVISIFAFVKTSHDLTLYILILSLSLLLGNLTLFPSLHKYLARPNWQQMNIWQHLKPAMVLFVPQIATQIYLVLNKTMLGSMVSVTAAGFFDQADKIVKIILAVVTATGTVMLPHVANAFAKGQHEKTRQYLYRSFSFVTALAVPMTTGLIAITPKLVPLFLSDKFLEVIPIMGIESFVILLIAWSNAIGTQYLLPTNQNQAFTTSVILGSVVNLIANIPLILWWGAVGTAVATVISEVSVTLYQLVVIRHQIQYRQLFADFDKYLFAGLIMFIVVFLIDSRLPKSWLMLLVEVAIGMVCYLLCLVLTRARIFADLKAFLKGDMD